MLDYMGKRVQISLLVTTYCLWWKCRRNEGEGPLHHIETSLISNRASLENWQKATVLPMAMLS